MRPHCYSRLCTTAPCLHRYSQHAPPTDASPWITTESHTAGSSAARAHTGAGAAPAGSCQHDTWPCMQPTSCTCTPASLQPPKPQTPKPSAPTQHTIITRSGTPCPSHQRSRSTLQQRSGRHTQAAPVSTCQRGQTATSQVSTRSATLSCRTALLCPGHSRAWVHREPAAMAVASCSANPSGTSGTRGEGD
jgi:hypothetical protein